NSTSVARNIHIPSRSAACCWPRLSKWCLSTDGWVLADNFGLLLRGSGFAGRADAGVRRAGGGARRLGQPVAGLAHPERLLVGPADNHWGDVEVVDARRAGRVPLQPGGAPWVGGGLLPVEQRDRQVEGRDQVPDAQDAGPGGGHHVPHLELGRV